MSREYTDVVSRRMQEAVDFLYAIPKFTKKNPLAHTEMLMKELGNPQDSMKVIHVAGSNGKGSVCSFLFSILRECGLHAGMFTSPHLVDIRERFIVDGEMVSRTDFLEAYDSALAAAHRLQDAGEAFPTFFEMIFAIGMLLFEKQGVEYAILETGMGGRLDATNVVKKPLVCVITSVSLEHTEYLGDTIRAVAAEKAGIIKPGVPVVFDGNDEAVSAVILARANELFSESYQIHKNMCKIRETRLGGIDFSFASHYDKKTDLSVSSSAPYQMMNAALAVTAFYRVAEQERQFLSPAGEAGHGRAVCAKTGSDSSLWLWPERLSRAVADGIRHAFWPGRMQEVLPEVFFDGAHNPDGIRAFLGAADLLCREDSEKPLLLFSMVRDKDYRQALREILTGGSWEEICVTGIPSERGLTAEELAAVLQEEKNNTPFCGVGDYREAFRRMAAKKKTGQKLFVTGSLYFIGALLKEIQDVKL